MGEYRDDLCIDISDTISNAMGQARENSPELFRKPIYVSPPIRYDNEYELEEHLEQEQKLRTGERIVLIPYFLANSHWVGLLIEFQTNEQIQRAEYISPISNQSSIPNQIQKQFTKLYPAAMLQSRILFKHDNKELSAQLTVKNLVKAAESNETSNSMMHSSPNEGNNSSSFSPNQKSKLDELEEELASLLEKLDLTIDQLDREIQATKEQKERYRQQNQQQMIREVDEKLLVLQRAKELSDEITRLTSSTTFSLSSNQKPKLDQENVVLKRENKSEEQRSYVRDLLQDGQGMPPCARKTLMELLIHFQQKLLGETGFLKNDEAVISNIRKLQDQAKREELFAKPDKDLLDALHLHLTSNNYALLVRGLNHLLTESRSLNVGEIQRLLLKAEAAAASIRNKDVVLLIGPSGSGKSTTIQFLACPKMIKVQVEVSPGKYLPSIEAAGPITNPELLGVKPNPLKKSETRYIAPVTVPLKDVLGTHKTGVLILCDAPGFDDSAGPEVDIANSIGIIAAIHQAKSVKLLVLSSAEGVGDNGQGILELAYVLSNMIHGIEDRLGSILYGFTKYSAKASINSSLCSLRIDTVEKNENYKSNSALITLLDHMINETEEDALIIDPLSGDRKKLIYKLMKLPGIRNPEEVFQFSMSQKTRNKLQDHVHKDREGITNAIKSKDYNLVLYYLNDLEVLKSLVKESFIGHAYEESTRSTSESISDYCMDTMEKFDRALSSRDGLQEKDVSNYEFIRKYVQEAQILKKHLQTSLLSPEALIQNIIIKLNSMKQDLEQESITHPLLTIYLDNCLMLKSSFPELEEYYQDTCKMFAERFRDLAQKTRNVIVENDFKQVAENLVEMYRSANAMKNHLHGRISETYSDVIRHLLKHLDSFSVQAETILMKLRLKHEEVELIRISFQILRSAKENSVLKERVLAYIELSTSNEQIRDLNGIYQNFLDKTLKHFDEIKVRIKDLLTNNGDRALEHIQSFIKDMDELRKIPDIESNTSGAYYQTIESIGSYTRQLQSEVEKLFNNIDGKVGITNYRQLARSLMRLKNAGWISEISSGTYDTAMNQISEELIQTACQLEDRFLKIDFSLKHPENIPQAKEIVEKIESMRDLESCVTELVKYRSTILHRFQQCTQEAFDRLQKTFNLEDKTIYQMKQKLRELEEIKAKCEQFHPARTFLEEKSYSDPQTLNEEIEELRDKKKELVQLLKTTQKDAEAESQFLQSVMQKYDELSAVTPTQTTSQSPFRNSRVQSKSKAQTYLESAGFENLQTLKETIEENQQNNQRKLSIVTDEMNESEVELKRLESIRNQYESLQTSNSSSSQIQNLLQTNGIDSYAALNEIIREKRKIFHKNSTYQPSYHFSGRLEVFIAENGLVYTSECEKVIDDSVRRNAIDANEKLQNYLREYGLFLKQQINMSFTSIQSPDDTYDPFSYSQNFEMRLQELLSYRKYPHVFKCINGDEMIEEFREKFLEFFNGFSSKMEENKNLLKINELKDQIIIAQALVCIDRFCGDLFAGNGFAALYRQYQGEVHRACGEAYRAVLVYISQGDYVRVDFAILQIPDTPFKHVEEAQMRHDLSTALTKLLKDTRTLTYWLDGKITREDSLVQISIIKENIDKIRIACNKHAIMKLLDESLQTNLRNFGGEMDKELSSIILKGLTSIENFMDADSFSEAEHGMERLNKIQRESSGYCASEKVTERSNSLRQRLDKIVTDISTRHDIQNIDTYPTNPPKDLLGRLKAAASHGNAKCRQAYAVTVGKIRETVQLAIENARQAPFNERSGKIHALNYPLRFLPEDLQIEFRSQIEDVSRAVASEEEGYRQDLNRTMMTEDSNDLSIERLGVLAKEYDEKKVNDLLKQLCEECLRKVKTYRADLQKHLEVPNIRSAVEITKKIFKYDQSVGDYATEIGGVCRGASDLLASKIHSYCETLANMASIEHTQLLEKTFDDISLFVAFAKLLDERFKRLFSPQVFESFEKAIESVVAYFHTISETFSLAINEKNITELQKVLLASKKWQKFFEKLTHAQSEHKALGNFSKKHLSYSDMSAKLEEMIELLLKEMNVAFITDDTTTFAGKREELFRNLAERLDFLKKINSKLQSFLTSSIEIEACERDFREKIDKIKEQLLAKACRNELLVKDTDEFRMYYNHLCSIDKYLRLPNIEINRTLEETREKILVKAKRLNEEIVENIKDAVQVASAFVQLRFLAENLSMFEKDINEMVDNGLKSYRTSERTIGIACLCVELQKTDIGDRLISEHPILARENLKILEGKTIAQNNIDYVLEKIEGHDISKDILRRRYKTYKEKYDELLRNFLKILRNNEKDKLDLDVLVTETKLLVGPVNRKDDSVSWPQSFRDNIPELLAYISVIWTLLNSQRLNTMVGRDESQCTVISPHVPQIVAVFRLLGIGYEKKEKPSLFKLRHKTIISDDLLNNLVEIGTGEGKSVVLALTACVFALTGIDVNCSCYSEVLSTRDKNDFASVFQNLGIQDRVEYGTFNKLCEQLLNEQCNIREKVRDIISTNSNTLSAIDASKRKRPKVLLIDEVDVFLSDKYYGGLYIPCVHLRSPSVKALLDSIWKNKSVRSLNAVKALPSYKACSIEYSNWMVLFDEAIKDMLAALRSYQSSTYMTQQDKIVYIEGESIVDNVVRGYDTVWAYYHENEKGYISAKGLEDNVGIIINCGTFSYAEMPHEFAYIAGVTGTLRTLADIERKILEDVYGISRVTYIPSIFGKNNRTYNPMTDVRVISEGEHFAEICEEINLIRDAKRAMLIFFESEEKLMQFYTSIQLAHMKHDIQRITETVDAKERDIFIRRASTFGKITLLTRTFGRGTDFICRDQQLSLNGGVHVLQTFFSEELSEEYQIMGRGARQGDRGSYRMIIADQTLEWVVGSSWREDLPEIKGAKLYESLNIKRNKFYEGKCGAKALSIEHCKIEHSASKNFMIELLNGNIVKVKELLKKRNIGASLETASSRTVLLMDATGSMTNLLSTAKETVCTVFERTAIVLADQGLPNDAFQMQFVVYRDYDCKEEGVLQSSAWETRPINLRNFMTQITAMGGGDYEEAIEIGLWYAAQQNEQPDGISQVILIGDAPAKDRPAIQRDRQANGGEGYWQKTKYNKITHYTEQLQRLKARNIPVHAFYLHDGARENFRRIATETSGSCGKLDINSSHGAEFLIKFVAEEVLRKSAASQGDAAVELYRKKFSKFFS